MLQADGFYDFAIREDGPADRPYPWDNSMEKIYLHSMVGYVGSYSALRDPNRKPTAWHGTVAYDGTLHQYYKAWAGLAHGGPKANPYGPGFEAEGGHNPVNEPLTPAQVATYQRIIADTAAFKKQEYTRANGRLVEHGEVAATACPSGRYAPLYAALLGASQPVPAPLPEETLVTLPELVAALGGREAIKAWNLRGNSLIQGFINDQARMDQHAFFHSSGKDTDYTKLVQALRELVANLTEE